MPLTSTSFLLNLQGLRSSAVHRNHLCPPEIRPKEYEDEYDTQTVFYDISHIGGGQVELVAPPFLNLADEVRVGSGAYLVADLLEGLFSEENAKDPDLPKVRSGSDPENKLSGWSSPKTQKITLSTEHLNADGTLSIQVGQLKHKITPREAVLDKFSGRKVLVTWNHNNDLAWVEDWARFYGAVHGVDGILLYDNASSLYSREELLAALELGLQKGLQIYAQEKQLPVSPVGVCAVANWEYPFGPARSPWESYFSPASMLEHARSTVLADAEMVLYFNIDEYLLAADTALEDLLTDDVVAARVPGYPVVNIPLSQFAEDLESSRVWKFAYSDPQSGSQPRLVFSPRALRAKKSAYLNEAGLQGLYAPLDERFRFAHSLPLTTGWGHRMRRLVPLEKKDTHWIDPLWIDHLQRAFADHLHDINLAALWSDNFSAEVSKEYPREFARGYVTRALEKVQWDKSFVFQFSALMYETKELTTDRAVIRFRLHVNPERFESLELHVFAGSKISSDELWAAVKSAGYKVPDFRPYNREHLLMKFEYDEGFEKALRGLTKVVLDIYGEAVRLLELRSQLGDGQVEGEVGATLVRQTPLAEGGLWRILKPATVTLPANKEYFRMPSIPAANLNPRYMALFDSLTLLTDIFCEDGKIIAVGPPRLNLIQDIQKFNLYADSDPLELAEDFWEELDRASRMFIPVDVYPDTITVRANDERWTVHPGRGYRDVFADRVVAITMNRNNDLQAIQDWFRNLVVNHKVTAAIIYDNGSTLYTHQQLLDTLKGVEGLEVGFIMDWPQKFGPVRNGWKSDFGQYIAWEHARWRFVQNASHVLQGDVDEMVMTEDERPITDYIDEAPSGAVRYQVCDAPPVPRPGLDPERKQRLCTDYLNMDIEEGPFSSKIAYSPQRVPLKAQIKNHQVWMTTQGITKEILARHIRGTHIGWRNHTAAFDKEEREFDPATDRPDPLAEKWYRRTFPERFED